MKEQQISYRKISEIHPYEKIPGIMMQPLTR